MDTQITSKTNKYKEFEKQLIENAHIWGLNNLDVIEILANLREFKNGQLGK